MVDSGWAIRLFETNDYSEEATIDIFSNFKKTKARMLDTVVAFTGMYGIDNYLVWNLHKDLPNYDFSTVALDLNIFMYQSTELVSFQDFYRVQDIRYNTVKSQYTIYALSESTIRLRAKLAGYNVTSLSYKENRTAKEILEEVLQKNNIFYIYFHEDNDATKNMLHYEYRYFDIDPEWTVLDFIEYIADDNQYEWCIDSFVDKTTNQPFFILHIGHELEGDLYLNASKPTSMEIDNISESLYCMKITTDSSVMQPLSNWESTHKCIWSKHTAGKGGGISKGCFVPTGLGHFDKHLYLRTLEGKIERAIGSSMLNRRKVRIPSIGIGNILKDEGALKDGEGQETTTLEYIDEVSIQKNPKTYTIREPHNIIINRGEDLAVQHQLEKATRWSPYLDHQAGLMFPSPKLDNPPPNSLIFNVDGKRESAVVGGYVYGNGRNLEIPLKRKDDFRLKMPSGGDIYYQSDMGTGDYWIIEAPDGITIKTGVETAYNEIPHQRKIRGEGTAILFHDDFYILEGPISLLSIDMYGNFLLTPKTDITGENAPKYVIGFRNDSGLIEINCDNELNIEIKTAGTLSAGTININTTGTVNIGAGASAVNIAGGAKALSRETHTHTTPVSIPGPPETSTPTTDNTQITKAD